MYVVLVALIVTTILVNVSELRILWSDSRKNKHEINRKGVAEIVYDFVQCGIVLVYILITFIAALRSGPSNAQDDAFVLGVNDRPVARVLQVRDSCDQDHLGRRDGALLRVGEGLLGQDL